MSRLSLLLLAGVLGGSLYVATEAPPAPLPEPLPAPAPLRPLPIATPCLHVFTSTGCVHCGRLQASLNDPGVRAELGRWDVRYHHDDHGLAGKCRVSGYPTCIAHVGGPEVDRLVGYRPPGELRSWLHRCRASRSQGDAPGKPVEGGLVSPDGTVEIQSPLPASEKKKNVGGSDGAGLCVFTSIEYCARWANERSLFEFQQQMRKERGGGWPEKVDKMLAKYAPAVEYLQDTTGDYELLKRAMANGRMVAATYCGADGAHYRGNVSHMITVAHADDRWVAITDNNFPGDAQVMWMSPGEFIKRWKGGGGGGWQVVLRKVGPPPVPRGG